MDFYGLPHPTLSKLTISKNRDKLFGEESY